LRIRTERLTREQLCEEGHKFNEKFNPEKKIPIQIDLIIEKDLGIDIVPIPGLKEYLENDAFTSKDFSTIYVDLNICFNVETRYRFSLAHEIGHYWLHESIFKDLDFKDVESWIQVYHSIDDDDYSWLEYQANQFAGCVLIPGWELEPLFYDTLKSISAKIKQAQEYYFTENDYIDHALDLLSRKLAPRFNVSPGCMSTRIRNDKKLRDNIS